MDTSTAHAGERRDAEQALRESESRLRILSDNLPEALLYQYRIDAGGGAKVDFISAGIERLTGVPASDYMRDAANVERHIVPEDHERLRAAIARSREHLTQFELEVRHRHRATGEVRWSYQSGPRLDSAGDHQPGPQCG